MWKLQKWNSLTTLRFIEEFKSQEPLSNPLSWSYRSKSAKDAAFGKIVENMNIPGFGVPEAKKKMRILRSTYYQEKKKIQNSRYNSKFVYVSNLLWFQAMDDLFKDIGEKQLSIDNIKQNIKDEEIGTNGPTCIQNGDETSVSVKIENIQTSPKLLKSFWIKKETIEEMTNQDVSKKTETEDRYDMFGQSVAMQLRTLSFERAMKGQAEIQNILSDLSIDDYREKQGLIPSFYIRDPIDNVEGIE